MTLTQPPAGIANLGDLISASRKDYTSCIDTVSHNETISGLVVQTRLHYLKFDGNGQPMVAALAECLYRHVIDYCIAARNRPDPLTVQDAATLTKEARKLFIHPPATQDDPDQTGEAGEILLYFLLEAVLGAPQVVAKMELKTNPKVEVHGSDGIHMLWDQVDSVVDVYFGEAKLHRDAGSAMTSALNSVEAFHLSDMCSHEFKMATKHFKHATPAIQAAVSDLLRFGAPTGDVRINHALLIGYNWEEFGRLPMQGTSALAAQFRDRYVADAPRLHSLLQKRFDAFARKHLRFEVFFLPFARIQDFRDAFNAALD